MRRGVRRDLTACTHKLPGGADPTGFGGLFARRAIARATVLVDVASNARFVRNGADDPANQPSAEGLEHGHTFQVGKHMFWVKQEQHGEHSCVALVIAALVAKSAGLPAGGLAVAALVLFAIAEFLRVDKEEYPAEAAIPIYYCNEARCAAPNVKFVHIVDDGRHYLGLQALRSIKRGEELLAVYDHDDRVYMQTAANHEHPFVAVAGARLFVLMLLVLLWAAVFSGEAA